MSLFFIYFSSTSARYAIFFSLSSAIKSWNYSTCNCEYLKILGNLRRMIVRRRFFWGSFHSWSFRLNSFCLEWIILERNGEGTSSLGFSKIKLHACINITIVGTISAHSVSNKLKCFSHTIFCHFLLSLAKFLKFFSKNIEDLINEFISLWINRTVLRHTLLP